MSDQQPLQTVTLDFPWNPADRFFRTTTAMYEVVLAEGNTVTVRQVPIPDGAPDIEVDDSE